MSTHQSEVKKIYVQCPNWVGDFIMATPVFITLRQNFPQAKITFGLRPGLEPLMEGSDWCNEVFLYDKKNKHRGVRGWWRLFRELSRNSYDLTVILPNSFRTGLISFFTRGKRRIGHGRLGQSWMFTKSLKRPRKGGKFAPVYTGEHYAKLMSLLSFPVPELQLKLPLSKEARAQAKKRWEEISRPESKMKVLLTPGASFGASKLWPPEHFAKLIDFLGEKQQATVLLAPGPGEDAIAQKIKEKAKHPVHIQASSHSGLALLKGLIAEANLVVCNDTGPRHISFAFQVPTIVLMGPTSPLLTHNDLELKSAIILRIEINCSPCQQKVCPLQHKKCMVDLTPEYVYDQTTEFLRKLNP